MARPFLILQLRPEWDAADGEFAAMLAKGGLGPGDVRRIRLDRERLPEGIDLGAFSGVIVGGGPGCVSDAPEAKSPSEARIEADVLSIMPKVTARDIPFMGCCYGIGVLGKHLGADVSKERYGEAVGTADCSLTEAGLADPVLEGLPARFEAFVGHKEALQSLPGGCVHLVTAPSCPYQMIRYKSNVYATQFHPEADAAEFEARINIYKDHGYFAPEQAGDLIAMCHAADVHAPEHVLRNFVARYGR